MNLMHSRGKLQRAIANSSLGQQKLTGQIILINENQEIGFG
jgi:hypothetical protein